MKKTILLLILLITLTAINAQKKLSKDQQKVQETVVQFFEAMSNRDSIALKNYSTNDIMLIEYGSIWNADTLILKAVKLNTAPDFKRNNTIDFIRTTVTKKTAWTLYNISSEVTRNGKKTTSQWIETVIAVKKKKMWQIKVLHSTLIKRI